LVHLGRAPIDPGFVLLIEKNQENQVPLSDLSRDEEEQANGAVHSIAEEYRQSALYAVFNEITNKLVREDDRGT